jgi:carbamoyl-phosphate synthase large subunit
VNPRASRTVPFVAKAIGAPIAKIAARVMAGEKLENFPRNQPRYRLYRGQGSRLPVQPLPRRRSGAFAGNEIDRRSDGDRQGFRHGLCQGAIGRGDELAAIGQAVRFGERQRQAAYRARRASKLIAMGFTACATGGTADYLQGQGIAVERVNKVAQGRPHIVDKIIDGEIALVFNTTEGWQSLKDSEDIRRSALVNKVSYFTTASASLAAAQAIAALKARKLEVRTLQDYHRG